MMQIQSQLSQLQLHGMSRSWQALLETRKCHELSLSEGLELLLQAEENERRERKFRRLQRNAFFRYQASIEELQPGPARGLDKALLNQLATGEYLATGESILISGATGSGKSFLASALGHQACAQGHAVAYFNVQKLLLKTKMARVDGTLIKFFEKLSKTRLLILDDFGLTPLDAGQRLDLMEIIEDRHGRASTIVASQLPISSWYEVIGEATLADAILDRLLHASYRIELKGESLRKKH
jgi:DNA replication protein DnaC